MNFPLLITTTESILFGILGLLVLGALLFVGLRFATKDSAPHYSLKEIVLGMSLTIALGGIVFAGLKYARVERFWKKRQEIFVVFENVGALTPNAPVRYNGLEIGRVKTLVPVHLDDKIIADKFRPLLRRDLNNLPVRFETLKRKLLDLPIADYDKAVRRELAGSTMIELCLEVLAENDPIRYRVDDEIRIVTTLFGDSVIEIISGSGPVNQDAHKQYVLGNAGTFLTNLFNSMRDVTEIVGGVKDVFGKEERRNFNSAQSRFTPMYNEVQKLYNDSATRMDATLKRYNLLTANAKAKLNKTGAVLESIQPAAETTTKNIQDALKDIQAKTQDAQAEAAAAMTDISEGINAVRDSLKVPMEQIRTGIEDVKGELLPAKNTLGKLSARFDAVTDPLGSMGPQSDGEFERFAAAVKKIAYNMKIAGFVAKENKDLMLGNRDAGEYAAQSALDIQHRLGMVSRRMTRASADALEAAREMESSDLLADRVLERAESTVKMLSEIRAPIDQLRDRVDEVFIPSWRLRKRANWHGDGLIRSDP